MRSGGRGGAGCYMHTHTLSHASMHSHPSIIISQDTGKASVSRHEAQDRTLGGARERDELERVLETLQQSAL